MKALSQYLFFYSDRALIFVNRSQPGEWRQNFGPFRYALLWSGGDWPRRPDVDLPQFAKIIFTHQSLCMQVTIMREYERRVHVSFTRESKHSGVSAPLTFIMPCVFSINLCSDGTSSYAYSGFVPLQAALQQVRPPPKNNQNLAL